MTTKDEALKQALDALCRTFPTGKYERELEQECRAAIAACREALEHGVDESAMLRDLIARRPAWNDGLLNAYMRWDAECYAALAQKDEQEPVAYGMQNTALTGSNRWMLLRENVPANDQYGGALWTPLYTAPPKRKPLTDEEIMQIGRELGVKCVLGGNPSIDFDYARAIERAHGIRGKK